MSLKKRIASLAICSTLVLGSINLTFADGARVVTLGANLSEKQKATMLKYFGVNENEVVISFYELRVKQNLTEGETNEFLGYVKIRLENMGYNVYFTGAKIISETRERVVQPNELMVAIKEKMPN